MTKKSDSFPDDLSPEDAAALMQSSLKAIGDIARASMDLNRDLSATMMQATVEQHRAQAEALARMAEQCQSFHKNATDRGKT